MRILALLLISVMYLRMTSEVLITNTAGQQIKVPSLVSTAGQSSWKTITDTATITLTRNTYYKDKNIREFINEGDKIVLKIGYNGDNKVRFKGYIHEISPGAPLVLRCEDEMYQLKNNSFEKSWKTISLKKLLEHIAPGYSLDTPDVELGKFVIDGESTVAVFDRLRKEYNLFTYFHPSSLTLHAGFPYLFSGKTHVFNLQKNIRKENLAYALSSETKIRVKAIANLANGKKLVVEKGDKTGGVRTLNYGSAVTLKELEKFAIAELNRVKYDGFKGSLTAFGKPFVQHPDLLVIRDDRYGREGKNLMDQLDWRFDKNGYSQAMKVATNG